MPKRESSDIKFIRHLPQHPISLKDIQSYKYHYIGSDLEKEDIKKAYTKYHGCLNQMAGEVLFMDYSQEPRVKRIISLMILNGELPRFKNYAEDNQIAQFKRFRNYRKEENKARELVCTQKDIHTRKTERLMRVGKIIKKYQKPKVKSLQKLRIKRGKFGDPAENQSYLKSTFSFMGEVVKGLFY